MKEKWSYEVETLIHLFIFLRRGGVQIVQCNTATYRNIWREDYQRIGTRHHYYSRYLGGWSPTWVHNAIMEGLVQEDQQQQKKYLVLLPSLTSHTHIRIKSPPTPIIINDASSLVLRVLILHDASCDRTFCRWKMMIKSVAPWTSSSWFDRLVNR